jgi:hypothetical protein
MDSKTATETSKPTNMQIAIEDVKHLAKEDHQQLQMIAQEENSLHSRLINLKYNQLSLAKEEKVLDEALSSLLEKRNQTTAILSAKYGQITSLNIETGEYTNA